MSKTTAITSAKNTTAPANQVIRRQCACGNHASGGECDSCAQKKVQRKMEVSSTHEPIDQEAEHISDQLIQSKPAHTFNHIPTPVIKRSVESSPPPLENAPESVERTLATAGNSLPTAVRKDMEHKFGQDFSQVTIHTGRAAEQSTRDLHANAYTVGNNIVFNSGKFSPTTHEGKRLLAHELTHVVQASNRTVSTNQSASRVIALEHEAKKVADIFHRQEQLPMIRGVAAGLQVPLCEGEENLGPAIYGNLHQSEPNPEGVRTRVELVQKDNVWYERQPNGKLFRAQGNYDFVIQNGRMIGVKGSRHAGGINAGHTEAANGKRVEYAGTVQFGSSKNQRGIVREWSNASGHYAPVRTFAGRVGLPMDKFKPVTEGFPEKGPQLPVFQPQKGDVLVPRDKSTKAPADVSPANASPKLPSTATGPTTSNKSMATNAEAPSASTAKPLKTGTSKPPSSSNPGTSMAGERKSMPAPAGAFTRPSSLIDGANAKAQAKGNGAILVVQGVLAILTYFADKHQRARADAAWAEAYPRIQEEITRTGRGVVVYVEYTRNAGSSVLIFEGIHWSSGGNDSGQPGSIRGRGQTASFSRTYVGPTEAQASLTDETALSFRRDEARNRQRDIQRIVERMSKEGWLGRKLLERAGSSIDPIRAYDAKAHIASASQSIKDKRYGDAAASLDKADVAIDEMWVQIKAYVGDKKMKELSGEN